MSAVIPNANPKNPKTLNENSTLNTAASTVNNIEDSITPTFHYDSDNSPDAAPSTPSKKDHTIASNASNNLALSAIDPIPNPVPPTRITMGSYRVNQPGVTADAAPEPINFAEPHTRRGGKHLKENSYASRQLIEKGCATREHLITFLQAFSKFKMPQGKNKKIGEALTRLVLCMNTCPRGSTLLHRLQTVKELMTDKTNQDPSLYNLWISIDQIILALKNLSGSMTSQTPHYVTPEFSTPITSSNFSPNRDVAPIFFSPVPRHNLNYQNQLPNTHEPQKKYQSKKQDPFNYELGYQPSVQQYPQPLGHSQTLQTQICLPPADVAGDLCALHHEARLKDLENRCNTLTQLASQMMSHDKKLLLDPIKKDQNSSIPLLTPTFQEQTTKPIVIILQMPGSHSNTVSPQISIPRSSPNTAQQNVPHSNANASISGANHPNTQDVHTGQMSMPYVVQSMPSMVMPTISPVSSMQTMSNQMFYPQNMQPVQMQPMQPQMLYAQGMQQVQTQPMQPQMLYAPGIQQAQQYPISYVPMVYPYAEGYYGQAYSPYAIPTTQSTHGYPQSFAQPSYMQSAFHPQQNPTHSQASQKPSVELYERTECELDNIPDNASNGTSDRNSDSASISDLEQSSSLETQEPYEHKKKRNTP